MSQQDLQIPRRDRAPQPSRQTPGGVMSKNSLRFALLLFVADGPHCSVKMSLLRLGVPAGSIQPNSLGVSKDGSANKSSNE